ncbi:hypothetical protein E0H71_37505 [Rhizobium leguminosarum bv. viciae]|nr:hypothetical protein [Rhizobium leguminosarum]TCA30223.1 hypothetical protein E0H72_35575 [Rhizobium leguminosarum bv. viciae]TCA42997.1 hypothetical protein E0H71_37505 [Rhizobium leguminosarum bv. viciae]TCA68288.1 hypothetical protein E0H69_31130 [Rhizobium leguminosarum bv. viciae]
MVIGRCRVRNFWNAILDHSPPETSPTPQWHLDEHLFLMDMIAEPLPELQSDMAPEGRAIRARTLFRAVNGVVSISRSRGTILRNAGPISAGRIT